MAQPDAKATKAGAGPASVQGQPGTQASAGSRPARPPILVTSASFAPIRQALVASAVRNAKNVGSAPQGGAVILLDTTSDLFVEQRVTAIRDALKAAGITKIKEIRFEKRCHARRARLVRVPSCQPRFRDGLLTRPPELPSQPKVSTRLAAERPLISAGYTIGRPTRQVGSRYGEFAALAEFVPTRLLRKAISTAIAVAQGRDVPRRVEVPIAFHDSPENTGVASAQLKGRIGSRPRPSPNECAKVASRPPGVRHGVEIASWMLVQCNSVRGNGATPWP